MKQLNSRDQIEDLAQQLLVSAGVISAPINPAKIALHLGIPVEYEVFSDDLSGALIRKDSSSVIAINKNHSATRQAFTLAHELGHYSCKHKGDVFVDKVSINRRNATSSLAVDIQEIEANQFAASLLMPKFFLMPAFFAVTSREKTRLGTISTLAKKFAVSKKAMEYRLVNLALISPPDDDE